MTAEQVLRPLPDGVGTRLRAWAFGHVDLAFGLLRAVKPILKVGGTVLVTRYDDVREVFLTDDAFAVPYRAKLDVIMGGCPFFLGMGDTPEYRRDTAAMRKAIRREDIPVRLAGAVETLAEEVVDRAGGRLEVVDELVRRVTFAVLSDYFGVPDPPGADLRVWATRLFEFQFADPGDDPALRADVDRMAPALRDHIDGLIAARRGSNTTGSDFEGDDVLGRCLALQRQGEPGFSDEQIRTALMGMIVGGPPQPPMVVPQALEQLLRRPDALMGAQAAARSGDDALLAELGIEAEAPAITELRHVRSSAERKAADEVANREACADFDRFKPLFEQVQRELDTGMRETRPFELKAEIERGRFFIVGGHPVSAVAEAAARTPIRLLSFDDAQGRSLKERLPFFTESVIGEGVYEGVSETRTLGVGAQWLVRGDVPDDLVYGITRALWHPSTRRLLDNGHPKGPSIQLATATRGLAAPLHPGAARYYREAGVLEDDGAEPKVEPLQEPERPEDDPMPALPVPVPPAQ